MGYNFIARRNDMEDTQLPNNSSSTEELQIRSEDKLVKSFNLQGGSMKGKNLKMVVVIFLTVALGVFSGYFLSQKIGGTKSTGVAGTGGESGEKAGTVVGSQDESTFKDSAEGLLVKGGVDGEGSHHLKREGGESQNVYLTSSILDLDQYIDHKVKVWGETFSAQKAGWLMDVGRLKVLD